MNTLSHLKATAAPFAIGLASLIATPALAQTAPVENTPAADAPADDSLAPIIVTGSRISRPDLEATSPVATLSSEQIRSSNTVTVEQVLAVNPQFSAGTTAASNNPGDGSATLDLRGLGPTRTLVLLNGKRLPVYDPTGSVDVNQIPVALLKRIDVLSGGASAVYGSDAIAGVVNFILDDRFVGLRASGSAQVTGKGDGALYDASLTGGIRLGDRGNLVVSANYSHRDGVKYGDRDFSKITLCSDDLVSLCGSSNTVPTAFDIPGGGRQQITDSGVLTSNVQTYNFNPVNYAQIPFERYGATLLGRYEVTDNVEFYTEGSYQHIKAVTTLAPTATAGFFFNIDPNNPFLSASERDAFFNTANNPDLVINDGSEVGTDPTARAGTSKIGIRRRIIETGGRIEEHTSETWRALAGLRGTIGSSWHWDASAQYSEVKKNQLLRNDLSYTALQQALDVVAGPNGPQCFNTANGCVPLNLFGTAPLSQTALAFVIRDATQNNKTTQFVAEANFGGDLGFLKSPFADKPAALSFGADYRKETARTDVDPLFASGDLIFYGQGSNVSGKYDVKEAYAELKLPVVVDKPFFRELNLEAGYRYSDYSTVGGVSAYKFGADWTPVEGVRFRGNYQRAVRAPNVYELYAPIVAGTGSLAVDPCAGTAVSASTQAICIAQGAKSSMFNGTTSTIPQPISGQINAFYGGSTRLQAEKSNTYTVGVVLTPPMIRNFSLTVDYFNIKIGNAIESTPTSIFVNQCFGIDQNASSFACSSIKRNPLDGSLSGPIDYGVPAVFGNIAARKVRGIDLSANWYGGDKAALWYRLTFAGTYTISNTLQVGDDNAPIECAGRFGADCDTPLPKWKHVAEAELGWDKVGLTTRWRYIGPSSQDNSTDILTSRLPAVSYIDSTLRFDVNEKFTFSLGVLNLFDKKPPIIGDTSGATSAAGSTFPTVYDVLGRSFFAQVSAKF